MKLRSEKTLCALLQQAETPEQIQRCFSVLRELRPHLQPDTFVQNVTYLQKKGYMLIFLEVDQDVVAVAGYRIEENLARGRFLYIDDLVTSEIHQRQGYGRHLLEWLMNLASHLHCQSIHLDSALIRESAHQFYAKMGLIFSSKHFRLDIE